MKRHRIRVKVEFEEFDSESPILEQPGKVSDGCFEIDLPEPLAINIDACEQAVLAANFPAIRDALSTHLSEMSKKNAKRLRTT